MKESDYLFQVYTHLHNKRVCPILYKEDLVRLGRTYEVKNPLKLLEIYVRYSKSPVIKIIAPIGQKPFAMLNPKEFKKDYKEIRNEIKSIVKLFKIKRWI